MRFRNSIRLLMENFKNVYKILIYQLVVSLITTALSVAFVLPEILHIWDSAALQEVLADGKEFLTAFFELNSTELNHWKEQLFGANGSVKGLLNLLSAMRLEIILTIIGCVFVYLLKRFTDTLCYFAIGSILNDKMATYAETGFGTAYISNLGKASLYALVYVPVVFLFDVITLAACYVMLRFLPVFAALFLSATLIVVCQSLKLTFTSPWLPAMTADNKPLREAVRYKNDIEKRQTSKVFSTYLVTVYVVIILNIIAAVCTFGSALLVTIPASYLLFICEQYVNYYTMKGKKYFITYERIETNPDFGDSEHFFEYIEEEEKAEQEEKAEETATQEEKQETVEETEMSAQNTQIAES